MNEDGALPFLSARDVIHMRSRKPHPLIRGAYMKNRRTLHLVDRIRD